MALINALRRARPSVPLEKRTQPSGCRGPARHLRRHALRAEPATGALISIAVLPPGGGQFYRLFPTGPRGRTSFATSLNSLKVAHAEEERSGVGWGALARIERAAPAAAAATTVMAVGGCCE